MNTMLPEDSLSGFLAEGHQMFLRLLIERLSVQTKMARFRLEESVELLLPSTITADELKSEFQDYNWFPDSNATSATSFHAVISENPWELYRWRWLTEFRIARWREIFALVRRYFRLGTRIRQLLLSALPSPSLADHLSHKEHIWLLLHGAHPPRQDAEIFRPVFAQFGEGTMRISLASS